MVTSIISKAKWVDTINIPTGFLLYDDDLIIKYPCMNHRVKY